MNMVYYFILTVGMNMVYYFIITVWHEYGILFYNNSLA
jgi:hypothetical protein